MFRSQMIGLAAGLAALALAGAPAQAQEVSALKVTAGAPTTVRVDVTGLQLRQVRRTVTLAAHTVCRNAVLNHELDYFDGDWCAGRTADRAMGTYREAHAHGQVATADLILVAAR